MGGRGQKTPASDIFPRRRRQTTEGSRAGPNEAHIMTAVGSPRHLDAGADI